MFWWLSKETSSPATITHITQYVYCPPNPTTQNTFKLHWFYNTSKMRCYTNPDGPVSRHCHYISYRLYQSQHTKHGFKFVPQIEDFINFEGWRFDCCSTLYRLISPPVLGFFLIARQYLRPVNICSPIIFGCFEEAPPENRQLFTFTQIFTRTLLWSHQQTLLWSFSFTWLLYYNYTFPRRTVSS